jgi:hypothetical protein
VSRRDAGRGECDSGSRRGCDRPDLHGDHPPPIPVASDANRCRSCRSTCARPRARRGWGIGTMACVAPRWDLGRSNARQLGLGQPGVEEGR